MVHILTRPRRTKAEIAALKALIFGFAREEHPTNLRHLFYRLEGVGAIAKTDAEYHQVVIRLARQMRLKEELPFEWIVDNTRAVIHPQAFDSVEQALMDNAKFYRKRLWSEQKEYVEVWTEKAATQGIIAPVTELYDVPLYPAKGQPSLSFLWASFEALAQQLNHGKQFCRILVLTDYDRSGHLIDQNIRAKLRFFWDRKFPGRTDFDDRIKFERLAVTREQIVALKLPTRPPKPHERDGYTENVELDAMPTEYLRGLVRQAIERSLPATEFEMLKAVEAEEQIQYRRIARQMRSQLKDEEWESAFLDGRVAPPQGAGP